MKTILIMMIFSILTNSLIAEILFENGKNVLGIPFQHIQDKMYMEIKINDTLTKKVILDTGLGMQGALLMDPQDGKALGLTYQTSYELGGAGEDEGAIIANVSMGNFFTVPGLKVTDQIILVMKERRDNVDNWPADGILGISFFEAVVEIDYENEIINLFSPQDFDDSSYEEEIKINGFSSGIPVIEVEISVNREKSHPVQMIVDTGCEIPFLYDFSDKHISLPEKLYLTETRILAEGMSGEMNGVIGRITSLSIGKYDFEKVITIYPDQNSWEKAAILGQNGIMGLSVLDRFKVAFDYSGERILLKPNANFGSPFQFENLGAVIQFDKNDNVEIVDIFIDSPAQEGGLKANDVILEMDGKKVPDISYQELIEIIRQENVTLELTIIRKGEIMIKFVRLKKFI